MSKSKTLIELAVAFAAGDYTEDQLHGILEDNDAVSQVISFAGGFTGAALAASVTKSVLDTEVVTSITDTSDDILDEIGSLASELNPFN
jgi:hypothetical protein